MYILGFIVGVVLSTIIIDFIIKLIKNKKHKMTDYELECAFDEVKHVYIRSVFDEDMNVYISSTSCPGTDEIFYYCMCKVRNFDGTSEDIQKLYNRVLEYIDHWKKERKEYWQEMKRREANLKRLKEIRKHLDKRRKRR